MSAARTDTLQHKIGTCPACHCGLWADIDVEVSVSSPTIDSNGRAHAAAFPNMVAARLGHECDSREESA